VPVGGYDVVQFDQAKAKAATDDRFGPIVLTPDATDDEKYLAEQWGGLLLAQVLGPEVWLMLRARSKRIRSFELYEIGPRAFLEFAQTPLTPAGVKSFADRYGPLMSSHRELHAIEHFFGHHVTRWYMEIREMNKAVALWEKGPSKANASKLVRLLERRDEDLPYALDAPGTTAKVLLKEDPESESTLPRICIRPSHLCDALWIQLAQAIDGCDYLRTCIECKRWFTIKSGQGRSDKEYCSDACKMRAYRKRKGGKRRGKSKSKQ
jgi:hypothetical protein